MSELRVRRDKLRDHVAVISRTVAIACGGTPSGPLLEDTDGGGRVVIGVRPRVHIPGISVREVTSDLGSNESVIGLPVPGASPPLWLGLHETWEHVQRPQNTVAFVDCGLRVYLGQLERTAAQILRLEWVAPKTDGAGAVSYPGRHAGQPHWHIDRAALFDALEYQQLIERLTSPAEPQPHIEVFDLDVTSVNVDRIDYDCSWLPNVHFPAQSGWMCSRWDGVTTPGPQQSVPTSLDALQNWWEGAMNYIIAELRAHAVQ